MRQSTLLFFFVLLNANLFGQNVYIPDANFKAILIGNPLINTNSDTEIQVSEAIAFDGYVHCGDMEINDLTGIEAFTALTELYCGYNQLTSLNLSQNNALEWLECQYNQLTNLDVSQNTALEWLACTNNPLTSLDLSQNTTLIYLICDYNQLTSLDVSQNTALTLLDCQNNQLTCLNIANGINTPFLGFVAYGNPNLSCIEVDDAEWATAHWTNIDPQTSFSEDCNNDCSSSNAGTNELSSSKNLILVLDLMGRETSFKPNTPLIYVYDDGSIEKVFSVEY
jgi:Leucine-rich repeat (LRR) protein